MRTGRSRWSAAAGVAAATALVATAVLTLTGEPIDTAAAAAGAQAGTAEASARTSTATGPTRPPSATVDDGTPPEYPTVPGATADSPFVAFIGDSWTAGEGATDGHGYAPLTGRLLGWEHRVLGVGGSGYVRGGAPHVPFHERIAPAVVGNPDVVVVQGSINEHSTPSPDLAAAVTDTLTRLVAAAGPDTTVLVVGASHVPGLPVPSVDQVNDVVRAEADRQGLRFVDVAAEGWSDPADPSIWADPYHLDDAGARAVAERLAPLLRGLVVR